MKYIIDLLYSIVVFFLDEEDKKTYNMKIIIKKNDQTAEFTIDTKDCHYPYAVRDAIELALELDGYTEETIKEVFGIMPDRAVNKE